ncbi:MAG: excinuclease ABC subunit C [Acidobacteriales bacterium]|nr:excinuclease ABC subunit C [Terriglobales bacterium]
MPAVTIPFTPERDREIFAQLPATAGVFLLRGHDEQAEPYVSKAADLRRRIQRLLAPPESHSKRLNLRERCAQIEFTPTGSDFENGLLLYRVLREVFPATYTKRLRLNLSPVIRVHWENAYPRAYITRKLGAIGKKSNYFGPFPSRAAAEKFLNDSLDLFKSRRCTFELDPDPSFPGCVYSEMKMCLAPCFKGCTDEAYMAEMHRAESFFETRGQSLIGEFEAQREHASADMEFEAAAALHAKLEKVKSIVRGCDEIFTRLDRLDALIIQPSLAPDSVTLFRFTQGQLLGPVEFSTLGMLPARLNAESGDSSLYGQPMLTQPLPESAAADVTETPATRLEHAVASLLPIEKVSATAFAENLALLKRWYYRSHHIGEIFFPNADGAWPARKILNGIGRVFGKHLVAPVAREEKSTKTP